MSPAASLDEFRKCLLAAFPPQTFHARISSHDECDDGIFLQNALHGQRWDKLPSNTLFHASIALPLLTPEALAAFLPAWLLHAANNICADDITTQFTIYFLCPGNPHEGFQSHLAATRAALFSSPQRAAVVALIRLILETPTHHHLHPYAQFGLQHWPG